VPHAAALRPVPLQELRLLPEGRRWTVAEHLSDLASLTPVRGEVEARHGGNVLEVRGEATTIVTLRCDRCLQEFNHALAFRCRELLWLGEPSELDPAVEEDGPIECLDPRGSFDPASWVFQQLSLQLPLQNRCGDDCPGPCTWSTANPAPAGAQPPLEEPPVDPRWERLRRLR
jgi:uncharacterized protein